MGLVHLAKLLTVSAIVLAGAASCTRSTGTYGSPSSSGSTRIARGSGRGGSDSSGGDYINLNNIKDAQVRWQVQHLSDNVDWEFYKVLRRLALLKLMGDLEKIDYNVDWRPTESDLALLNRFIGNVSSKQADILTAYENTKFTIHKKCFAHGSEKGASKDEQGNACLSSEKFEELPPEAARTQLLSIMIHEMAHVRNFNEDKADQIQQFILYRAGNILSSATDPDEILSFSFQAKNALSKLIEGHLKKMPQTRIQELEIAFVTLATQMQMITGAVEMGWQGRKLVVVPKVLTESFNELRLSPVTALPPRDADQKTSLAMLQKLYKDFVTTESKLAYYWNPALGKNINTRALMVAQLDAAIELAGKPKKIPAISCTIKNRTASQATSEIQMRFDSEGPTTEQQVEHVVIRCPEDPNTLLQLKIYEDQKLVDYTSSLVFDLAPIQKSGRCNYYVHLIESENMFEQMQVKAFPFAVGFIEKASATFEIYNREEKSSRSQSVGKIALFCQIDGASNLSPREIGAEITSRKLAPGDRQKLRWYP